MVNKIKKLLRKDKVREYFKRTKTNKKWALMLIGFGCLHALLIPDDNSLGTMLLIGVPLFLCPISVTDEKLF